MCEVRIYRMKTFKQNFLKVENLNLPRPLFRLRSTHACQQKTNQSRDPVPLSLFILWNRETSTERKYEMVLGTILNGGILVKYSKTSGVMIKIEIKIRKL